VLTLRHIASFAVLAIGCGQLLKSTLWPLDHTCCQIGVTVTSCAIASLGASHKLAWHGTASSRIGMSVTPSTLLYATAGLAYGQLKTDYTLSLLTTSFATANFKDVKAG
jgi:opacity protein-like surface antigen